jgi:hypothetical protein
MKQFEYQITVHSAESFRELVYFCSEAGGCSAEQVSSDQIGKLEVILNEQGQRGWELAHASFGKQGMMIFWKKTLSGTTENVSEETSS